MDTLPINKRKSKMAYSAFVITPEGRRMILERWPAKFKNVRAHHITHEFGVINDTVEDMLRIVDDITIVGYACDGFIEALVVEVNGKFRPDKGTYHITLSYVDGKNPYDSNRLISDKGYDTCEDLFVPTFPALLD